MKLIFGGHWCQPPLGWRVVPHAEQDIGQRLKFPDDSVDAIFTEHVVEHVELPYGIAFMKDSLRVLKPGGVFRCVMPVIDVLSTFGGDGDEARDKEYVRDHLKQYHRENDAALRSVGLPGIELDPTPFHFDSLLKLHGHKFVWSYRLAEGVLWALGYSFAGAVGIGESRFDPTTCLERRVRGVKSLGPGDVYDPQSGVVEARK